MPLWLAAQPLVLASKSEARRAVLGAAGIPFEIHPADLDEPAVDGVAEASDPSEVVRLLARAKAFAVANQKPGRLVLGSDQTLALGARRFDKPLDRAAAHDQLRFLSGGTHQLYSGFAFVTDDKLLFEDVSVASLTMRPLSDSFIDSYLDAAGHAVLASVGAYQLEGLGVQLFERIEGDHSTILGLPMLPVLAFLRAHGCLAA